jgi:hypothetical protein
LLAICLLIVIALGMASRKYPLFPEMCGKYPGDALWSGMVYLGWAFWKPATPPTRVALYALLISYLDEFSQLIQVPWLNAIRQTVWGHLILGTVFPGYDILAYTISIFIALILDTLLLSLSEK